VEDALHFLNSLVQPSNESAQGLEESRLEPGTAACACEPRARRRAAASNRAKSRATVAMV